MLTDLEAKLRANPDDDATWLVYADPLQERGDPRGEVISLAHRLTEGRTPELERRYAARCRVARWPKEGPWPRMHYRVRFEQMFAELRAAEGIEVDVASIGPPRDDIAKWKAVAGRSWPDGMDAVYMELSSVKLEYRALGSEKFPDDVYARVRIPSLDLWDGEALRGELWFDGMGRGRALPRDSAHRSLRRRGIHRLGLAQ